MSVKQISKCNPVIFKTVEKKLNSYFDGLYMSKKKSCIASTLSFFFNNFILNYSYLSNTLKTVAADL